MEAGCILQNVQDAAEQAYLLFPLSLAAEGSCTIGGNLAPTPAAPRWCATATRATRAWPEVVTPQGEVWDGLRGLRKDNTGYDLRDLHWQRRHAGIITAATSSSIPARRPAHCLAAVSMEQAVRSLALGTSAPGRRAYWLEVMGRFAPARRCYHTPYCGNPIGQDECPTP